MNVVLSQASLLQGDKSGNHKEQSAEYDFFNDFLSFKRTPGKIQILHIDLWYKDGSTGEINITSPHIAFGENLERQYIFIKKYLKYLAHDLGVVAYQGSIVHFRESRLHTTGTFPKADCSTFPPATNDPDYERD